MISGAAQGPCGRSRDQPEQRLHVAGAISSGGTTALADRQSGRRNHCGFAIRSPHQSIQEAAYQKAQEWEYVYIYI